MIHVEAAEHPLPAPRPLRLLAPRIWGGRGGAPLDPLDAFDWKIPLEWMTPGGDLEWETSKKYEGFT